jgi:hypothetical protein
MTVFSQVMYISSVVGELFLILISSSSVTEQALEETRNLDGRVQHQCRKLNHLMKQT